MSSEVRWPGRWLFTLALLVLPLPLAVSSGCSKPNKAAGPVPLQSAAALPKCEEARSPNARDECYRRAARDQGAPGLCLRLQHPERQAECVEEAGDGVTACQQAETIFPVPDCYRHVARRTHEVSTCNFIKSLVPRGDCIVEAAQATNNPELCASVPRPFHHDRCWQEIAVKRREPTLCARLKNASRRDACRLSAATQVDGVAEACGQIENAAVRDQCWISLAGKEGAAEDVCEHVGARKNACFTALARHRGPPMCERVGAGPDSLARRLCYEQIFGDARSGDAIELCATVTDVVLKQECMRARAVATRDVALCQGITLPEIADDCFYALATKTPEACLSLKDPGRMRKCASDWWRTSHDPRMCTPLLQPNARRECAERMAKFH